MRTGSGNKISEAARQEILDRNASEGIEPRNFTTLKRLTVFMHWKAVRVDLLWQEFIFSFGV
jgi:hypothetical protein